MSRFVKISSVFSAVLVASLAAQAHAVGQLTDVSIYDRSAGRELPIYQHHGKYFVAGDRKSVV